MIKIAVANAGIEDDFMSKLVVVRHGQASFHADDYDQLSEIGKQQGYALGAWWARLGIRWDHVYIGPRKRHRQTADEVARAYRDAGMDLPPCQHMPELDEHQGTEVVKHIMGGQTGTDSLLPEGMDKQQAVRLYFQHFQKVTRRWVEGAHDDLGFESWRTFRNRVKAGIDKLTNHSSGKAVAAFTSGGPLAVSAGEALHLTDQQILEMSWHIRNASFNEFLFSDKGFSPVSFNALPHLDQKKWHTLV